MEGTIKFEYIIIIIFLFFLNILLYFFLYKISKFLGALENYLKNFPKNIEEAQDLLEKLFIKNIPRFSSFQDDTKALKNTVIFFTIISIMVLLKGLISILK
ncbi:MAG: hypothetical protein ACRDBY_14725 [Cetobacterium sp.]